MKLLIGLGNPGEKYKNNRHNVGQMFVDCLPDYQSTRLPNDVKILKTDCFMNDSGKFVTEQVKKYRGDWENEGDWGRNLFIVHDDLDIPLGKFKIDFGVGPKVHNGINSVEEALGTKEFWRVRIGIDNRGASGQARMTGEDYVLQNFSNDEIQILEEIFPKILEELKVKLKS